MTALIAAVAIAVVLGTAWLSVIVAERRRRSVQGRITAVLTGAPLRGASPNGAISLRREVPTGGAGALQLLPGWFYRYLTEELGATGDRVKLPSLVFAAVIGAVVAVGFFIALLRLPILVGVPLVVAAGTGAAYLYLRRAQQRFQRQFLDRFPDALDVIVRAVRAGLPVLDAMEAAIGNVSEPVASEFRRLVDQWRIGIDLEASLEPVTNRVRVNDFRFFAATLVLQRRTGGSLAETLADLADLIRRRKEIRLKVRALSAEMRASAYVIGALPFVMTAVMFLVSPGTTSMLFNDPRGRVMLGTAMALLVCGFALMNAMIKQASR
jgi:tight adherence protein B